MYIYIPVLYSFLYFTRTRFQLILSPKQQIISRKYHALLLYEEAKQILKANRNMCFNNCKKTYIFTSINLKTQFKIPIILCCHIGFVFS